MFEVEQKFRLAQPTDLLERLNRRGAHWKKVVAEIDTYFQHPSRDFVQTDEALRIRRFLTVYASGRIQGGARITYKGPKLDPKVKIRKEIELPICFRKKIEVKPPMVISKVESIQETVEMSRNCASGSVETSALAGHLLEGLNTLPELAVTSRWLEMLELLGFRRVHDVQKIRRKAFARFQGEPFELSFDVVPGLGIFTEIEFVAQTYDFVPEMKERLTTLSGNLGLDRVEPRSYLALVIQAEQEKASHQPNTKTF